MPPTPSLPRTTAPLGAFRVSAGAVIERERRRQILKSHPEIRRMFGPDPRSALLAVLLVGGQLGLAVALAQADLWIIVAVAVCPGAFLAADLTAMIHEAQHKLVFRGPTANRLMALVANLGLAIPSAMPFFRYHGSHHAKMGDYKLDVGIPTEAEVRWVGDSSWRKAVWLAAFPLFQAFRTVKYRDRNPYWTGWMIANYATQIVVGLAIFEFWGVMPLVYMALSYALSVGFHPLGTRVIQEHFLVADGQEINNYVGWASLLECNIGYHAEHHDFPRVAWTRLPRVSQVAPEFYRDTPVFRSRIALMVNFILDRKWNLYRHALRAPVP